MSIKYTVSKFSKMCLYHKIGLLSALSSSAFKPISETASAYKTGKPIPQGCLSLHLNRMVSDLHFLLNSVLSIYVRLTQGMPNQ